MKILLVTIAVILAGLLGLQWTHWPPEPVRPAATEPAPTIERSGPGASRPLELLEGLEDREDYAGIVERPLFLPDRRPPPDEPDEQPVEAPPPQNTDLAGIDLNAVILTPTSRTAYFKPPSGNDKLVKVELGSSLRELGDDYRDWTIKAIYPNKVELEWQDNTETLVLRDYSKPSPPASKGASPAARDAAEARRKRLEERKRRLDERRKKQAKARR